MSHTSATYYNAQSQLVQFCGLGLVSDRKRRVALSRSSALNRLFGRAQGKTKVLKLNPSIKDTMQGMANSMIRNRYQGELLYKEMYSPNPEQFLRNLFNWYMDFIDYETDPNPGEEETMRTLWQLWRDKAGDCDCYANTAGQVILWHPTLTPVIRVVRQPNPLNLPEFRTFHHVYLVIPKTPNADINVRSNYWAFDPVLDTFDKEVKYAEKIDLDMKDFKLVELGSVAPSLGCADCTKPVKPTSCGCRKQNGTANLLNDPMKAKLIEELAALQAGQVKAIDAKYNRADVIQALQYVLKYWDTPKRNEAIAIVQKQLAGASIVPQPLGVIPIVAASLVAGYLQKNPNALNQLTNMFGGSSGPSNKANSDKAIYFWKYIPNLGTRERYNQPVIYEPMSASYKVTDWTNMQNRDYSGLTVAQKEAIFPVALQIDPTIVDRHNAWPAFWINAKEIYDAAQAQIKAKEEAARKAADDLAKTAGGAANNTANTPAATPDNTIKYLGIAAGIATVAGVALKFLR